MIDRALAEEGIIKLAFMKLMEPEWYHAPIRRESDDPKTLIKVIKLQSNFRREYANYERESECASSALESDCARASKEHPSTLFKGIIKIIAPLRAAIICR